jgi:hypothetical protein
MKLRKGSGRSRAALLAARVIAMAFWIAAAHTQQTLATGPFTEAPCKLQRLPILTSLLPLPLFPSLGRHEVYCPSRKLQSL